MAAKRISGHWWLLWLSCSTALLSSSASVDYRGYLANIFQKYGTGGTMSFEGLEHLMYNLGLGQIEFDPTHTIDEHRPKDDAKAAAPGKDNLLHPYFEQETTRLLPNAEDTAPTEEDLDEQNIVLEFKKMHDPKHRHPREKDDPFSGPSLSPNVCLSPKSLLRLVVNHNDFHDRKAYKTVSLNTGTPTTPDGHDVEDEYNEFINDVKLTPVAFMKLCPALLEQIDQRVCVRPAPLLHAEDPRETLWNAWIYASGSIFILSACGLLGLLLVPLMKTAAYQEILKFLIAVAVGTLSGDALMHLLPHALSQEHDEAPEMPSHELDSHHSHENRAVLICGCTFATAVFMYVLESLIPLVKGNAGDAHGHSHNHSHSHSQTSNNNNNSHTQVHSPPPKADSTAAPTDSKEVNVMLDELREDKKKPSRALTPLAFMVVIGDGLHNLTDGLAIGAAFATDPVTGMATAFAVLCHELPHELGDFALLLQTGVSLRRAIYLNIVSSVLSFVGMAVGLLIAGLHSNMTQWIYAGTAGSFLYIAFADLLPAMAGEGKRDFKGVFIQILGIVMGGLIMLAIAVNEEDLEKLFK